MMQAIVTYQDGNVIKTRINGTEETIKEYFKIGKYFNIGSVSDNMQPITGLQIEEINKY